MQLIEKGTWKLVAMLTHGHAHRTRTLVACATLLIYETKVIVPRVLELTIKIPDEISY